MALAFDRMKKINKFGKIILFLTVLTLFSCLSLADSSGQLKVTLEHPFYLNGEWVEAKELQVGDVLKTYDGKKVRITNVEDIETSEPFLVYNLEDDFYLHNYIVDKGLVVHNSNAPKAKLDYYWEEGKGSPHVKVIDGKKTIIANVAEGRQGFERIIRINKGDKVKLFRFIDVPEEELASMISRGNRQKLYMSKAMQDAKGNWPRAVKQYVERFGGKYFRAGNDKFGVSEAIVGTGDSGGGLGTSTSFNGYGLSSPLKEGYVRLVFELKVPAKYLVAPKYTTEASAKYPSITFDYPRLPKNVGLNSPNINRYGFFQKSLYEGEVTFLKDIGRYVKGTHLYYRGRSVQELGVFNKGVFKSIKPAMNGLGGSDGLSMEQIEALRGW